MVVVGAAVRKQSHREHSKAVRAALFALCLLLGGSCAPGPARASSPASTTKGSGGATAPGLTVPGATAPSAPTHTTAPANKVTVASMTCVPSVHCSTNPHQVSVRGLLLVKGKGLKPGMVVAFPHTIGARIARNSP